MTYRSATALTRIAHASGFIAEGTTVTIEDVAVGIVRVHLPNEGIMFTCSSKLFTR